MSYASLLLHLDPGRRVDHCFEVAARLARRFEAHLTALATPFDTSSLPDAVADPHDIERPRRLAAEAVARFEDQARRFGLHSFEGVVAPGDAGDALIARGRLNDLVILGQADPARPDHGAQASLVARVVLDGAPPTLVVPYAGRPAEIGSHVLVGWSDSRPAARAIAAAMPLLRAARRVTLMHVMGTTAWRDPAVAAHLDEAVRWLARHGVQAHPAIEPSGVDPGDALLSRAADLDVDLVVMGAWSHSRLVERLRGGVTRTMLGSMTAPVLMAH
jgi:nucleotide-binding universal stress UspA family protein